VIKYLETLPRNVTEKEFDPYAGGGNKKLSTSSSYTSTGVKATFYKDGKKIQRSIYTNPRGTKVVKYNADWVLVSKLKVTP